MQFDVVAVFLIFVFALKSRKKNRQAQVMFNFQVLEIQYAYSLFRYVQNNIFTIQSSSLFHIQQIYIFVEHICFTVSKLPTDSPIVYNARKQISFFMFNLLGFLFRGAKWTDHDTKYFRFRLIIIFDQNLYFWSSIDIAPLNTCVRTCISTSDIKLQKLRSPGPNIK